MNLAVLTLVVGFWLIPAASRGADLAPVLPAAAASTPPPGGASSGGPRTPALDQEEASLRSAEAGVREAQLEVARRQFEVQVARLRVELARTEAEADAARGLGTRDGRDKAKALAQKAKLLKIIIHEDIPEVRALELRLAEARAREDTAGLAAIQKALGDRRRSLARRQTEGDLAMARYQKETRRVKSLELRLAEMDRQERADRTGSQPAR